MSSIRALFPDAIVKPLFVLTVGPRRNGRLLQTAKWAGTFWKPTQVDWTLACEEAIEKLRSKRLGPPRLQQALYSVS